MCFFLDFINVIKTGIVCSFVIFCSYKSFLPQIRVPVLEMEATSLAFGQYLKTEFPCQVASICTVQLQEPSEFEGHERRIYV